MAIVLVISIKLVIFENGNVLTKKNRLKDLLRFRGPSISMETDYSDDLILNRWSAF